MTALAATALLALGSGAAMARQGADDPAGHVRHSGADDGAKHKSKAKKCKKAKAGASAKARKRKKPKKHTAGARRADDGAKHAADDNGASRPAGQTDEPAGHEAGDDNGVDDPATHDVGDDNGVDPAGSEAGDDSGQHRNRGGDDA